MTGFTRVDNDVLEEVSARKFNASQLSVLMIVWRMTTGFNREDHELAINYFVQVTGLSKRGVQDAINSLLEGKVLIETQQASFNRTRKVAFNKNTSEWEFASRRKLLEVQNPATDAEEYTSPVAESCHSPVAESCHHEIKVKEIYKEKDDRDLMRKQVPYLEYEKNFGTPPPVFLSDLDEWIDKSQLQDPEEIICETIRRAKLHTPKYPDKYIKKIVDEYINLGLFTLDAVKAYNAKFDSKIKNHKNGAVPSLTNMFEQPKNEMKAISEKELQEIEEMTDGLPF